MVSWDHLQIREMPIYLIIALCTPSRHVTNWQKAVRAVSGEDILEDVTLDLTLMSRRASGLLSAGVEADDGGKQTSWLMGAFGW